MPIKNRKQKKAVEELVKNKPIEELVQIAARPQARDVIGWMIFAIASKSNDAFDKEHPVWAKDPRRRHGLECQAFILAEILRMLDGFKLDYWPIDEELAGTLYKFSPKVFWDEFETKGQDKIIENIDDTTPTSED